MTGYQRYTGISVSMILSWSQLQQIPGNSSFWRYFHQSEHRMNRHSKKECPALKDIVRIRGCQTTKWEHLSIWYYVTAMSWRAVKISADKNLALVVPPFRTVKYVKRMIQEKEGITIHMQCLIFAGNVLHDQISLNEFSTGNGSQLVLSRITQDEIFVRTMDGNVFKLRTKTCDIIHTLKSKIQSISGFSPGKQRLVFAGKHLTDTRFVGDYNIQTNSMILLFPRQ